MTKPKTARAVRQAVKAGDMPVIDVDVQARRVPMLPRVLFDGTRWPEILEAARRSIAAHVGVRPDQIEVRSIDSRSRRRETRMRTLWRDYGLSITLASMFLVAWALQTWTGWMEFVADAASHGQPAQAFGDDGYIWSWGQATFENWQSEFLQVFVFIVLTTFLVHRKSHESLTPTTRPRPPCAGSKPSSTPSRRGCRRERAVL